MEAKHTPGPWEVGWGNGLTGPTTPYPGPIFCGGKEWPFIPVSKDENTIAVVPAQDVLQGDYMGTARLIAAAPELLQAAKHVAFSNGFDAALPEKMEALRAVIAKAEGKQ